MPSPAAQIPSGTHLPNTNPAKKEEEKREKKVRKRETERKEKKTRNRK